MAKMVLDFPINLKKINPKSGHSRRFSTGNENLRFSTGNEIIKPLPLPNYLRASIGSCHDFCKYGARQNVPSESISTKHDKALGKKKLVRVPSSRQQPSESKPKALVRSDQSSFKQLNKPLLKSTKNPQTCHDHAGKGTKSVPLSCSSLPRSSGKESLFRRSGKNSSSSEKDNHLEIKKSVENPETRQNTSSGKENLFRRFGRSSSTPEKDTHFKIKKSIGNSETRQNTSSGKENLFRRSSKNTSSLEKDTHLKIKKSVGNSRTFQNASSGKKSIENSETCQNTSSGKEKDYGLEIKRSVENSETCQNTRYENVPEKIIHVVEPNDENRDEDLSPNGSRCSGLASPNQKQELDSEAKSRSSGARISNVVPKESDSSPRKLKFTKNGKALEIENVEPDSKGKSLRRVVSDGETSDPEKNVTMRGALHHGEITQKTTNPELMNVLIEETAGKLTSKSKVKALVDAFETLITFQDFECPSPRRLSV